MRVNIRHIALEKRQSIERKNHAVSEGSVGRILLEDIDAPGRKAALDEQREQKAGRTGADDINSHGLDSPRRPRKARSLSTHLSEPFEAFVRSFENMSSEEDCRCSRASLGVIPAWIAGIQVPMDGFRRHPCRPRFQHSMLE